MKKIILISIITLLSCKLLAEVPYHRCSEKPRFQKFYDGYMFPQDKIFIETGFTNSQLISPKDIKLLKNSDILAIDLVFSNYPYGGIYEPLNRSRLKSLERALPFLKSDTKINWRFIAIGQNLNENSAKSLFHGFVITYRKKASKESMMLEAKSLTDLNLIKITSRSSKYTNNMFTKIFERKKWSNSVFACDITGSMSPYLAQLITWLSLTKIDQEKASFLFFNDGDMTPDKSKVIGSTGGFYSCNGGKDFNKILSTMQKAMMNGFGGDCPENNIEALLALETKNPKAEQLVMVADNWAPIKDIALVDELKKPVRIILCGVNKNAMNIDYINLAYKTGGSIHTIERDIEKLCDRKMGSTLRLNNRTYILTKKGFIMK
jgi:hypothetical protein